jgi:uncharacterized protein (TIGR03000 family)
MSHSVPLSKSRATSGNLAGYESSRVQSSYKKYSAEAQSVASRNSKSGGEDRYEAAKPAIDRDAAMLTVAVPSESAKVTVNGHETTSEGTVRQFMSRGLKDGYLYTYVVEVSYEHNGEMKTERREVKLRPGENEQLVFEAGEEVESDVLTSAEDPAEPVVTVVKLHVPAEATVSLAGNETKGDGEVRTFRTTQLNAGDRWDDYVVRVTTEINGQAISKEQVISVKAGSTNELTFDFDQNSVATR